MSYPQLPSTLLDQGLEWLRDNRAVNALGCVDIPVNINLRPTSNTTRTKTKVRSSISPGHKKAAQPYVLHIPAGTHVFNTGWGRAFNLKEDHKDLYLRIEKSPLSLEWKVWAVDLLEYVRTNNSYGLFQIFKQYLFQVMRHETRMRHAEYLAQKCPTSHYIPAEPR